MSQTPTMTIHLSGDEVDAILLVMGSRSTIYTHQTHLIARTQLLERLRAHKVPVREWTAAEIEEREG